MDLKHQPTKQKIVLTIVFIKSVRIYMLKLLV